MLSATLFSAVLAFAPSGDIATPDFNTQLDRAEVVGDGGDLQVVAYDAEGEVVGIIALWVDSRGRVHVVSDYGDGYAETVITDGQAHTTATLPAEVLSERAEMIAELVVQAPGRDPQPKKSWLVCGAKVAVTAGSCATAQAIGCVGGAVMSACECLPLLVKEWKEKSCF